MPRRISLAKRKLKDIIRRHLARVEICLVTHEPAEKKELHLDEVMAFTEAH